MKIMKQTKTSIALAVVVAIGAQFAGAVPSMRISDGITTITINDGDMLDGSGGAGEIVYLGSLGLWSLTVNTGVTMPAQGSATLPYMDLNFIAKSTSPAAAPPSLTIEFSEVGFGPMASFANFAISIGGTSGGTVTCTTLLDLDNNIFGDGGSPTAIAGPQSFGKGAYSCSLSAPGQTSEPFSLTKKIVITHVKGTKTSSGDAELTVPDGGTTLALLGCSMLGLGAIRRKFGKV
jgi:hypothetical protein